MPTTQQITIKTSKLRKLKTDNNAETAEAVNLRYVSDAEPGIKRIAKGNGFAYTMNGNAVKDEETIFRIKRLVLPPAWTNVWICQYANGHLQATGLDTKGRKQYRYHNLWNTLRNHTKFSHLYDFGNALPTIKQQIQKDLALPGLQLKKILATIVSLMQCTCIRIGNDAYEKLYGSFGLTTLKDRHVKQDGSNLKFVFKGKKGVYHDIKLESKKLVKIVKQCRDIPGRELFQYYDDDGARKPVDSGMVNDYIKSISNAQFTSKDFRTWSGTLFALEALCGIGISKGVTDAKRKVAQAFDIVAKRLGNTRNVCKKYYVHPVVIDHYSDNSITKYFKQVSRLRCSVGTTNLTPEEQVLMRMLKETKTAVVAI